MEDDKNKPKHELNEPAAEYVSAGVKHRITFYKSFEEAEEAQHRYFAGLTPEQCFADFHALMHRFYKFEQPDWSKKKIVIDK